MRRGKSFSCSTEPISLLCFLQIVMLVAVLLLHHHHQSCDAITNSNNQTYCPPSSCGKISNIKHPFRLKDDPSSCGDPRYELSCENNITTLTLFSGKYYVKEINYKNYTIQLVDPGIEEGNCSSIPRYFLTTSNFTFPYIDINNGDTYQIDDGPGYIIYLKCSKAVNDDHGYVDTAPCINSDSKSYLYAFAADLRGYQDEDDLGYVESYSRRNYFSVGRLKDYCQVKLVAMSSSDFPVSVREDVPDRSLSYEEIHGMLLYGFELSWISGACRESCGNNKVCGLNDSTGDIECYEPPIDDYCVYPLGMDVNKGCDQLSKQLILVQDIILGIVKVNRIVYPSHQKVDHHVSPILQTWSMKQLHHPFNLDPLVIPQQQASTFASSFNRRVPSLQFAYDIMHVLRIL